MCQELHFLCTFPLFPEKTWEVDNLNSFTQFLASDDKTEPEKDCYLPKLPSWEQVEPGFKPRQMDSEPSFLSVHLIFSATLSHGCTVCIFLLIKGVDSMCPLLSSSLYSQLEPEAPMKPQGFDYLLGGTLFHLKVGKWTRSLSIWLFLRVNRPHLPHLK